MHVYFDGTVRSLKKGSYFHAWAIFAENTKETHAFWDNEDFVPFQNSLYAEFMGLRMALKFVQGHKSKVLIMGDCNLVLQMLQSNNLLESNIITPIYKECVALIETAPQIDLIWIPRIENKADNVLADAYGKTAANKRKDWVQNNNLK